MQFFRAHSSRLSIILKLLIAVQFAFAENETAQQEVARLIRQESSDLDDLDVIDLHPPLSSNDTYIGGYEDGLAVHEVHNVRPFPGLPPGVEWNEEGQYWGYKPALAKETMQTDESCVPPYCVPALCSGEEAPCNQKCVTQNCNVGCYPFCIGGSQCIGRICQCEAFRRQSDCNLIDAGTCQSLYGISCAIGCFKPASVIPPPGCDCLIPFYVLLQPMCATEGLQTCPNNCSYNGRCDQKTGTCACNPGFAGADCSSKDLCLNNPDLPSCEYGCISLNNSRLCTCPEPLVLQPDGVSCGNPCPPGLTGPQCSYDIDECLTGIHDCEYHCVNTYGSYECECLPGMTLDPRDNRTCLGRTCDSPCLPDQGECIEGGICKCHPGFQGRSCELDVDECALRISGCNHDCVNTFGSFRCICRPGFDLDPRDNKTCIPKECNPSCTPGQGDCVEGKCQCKRGFEGPSCERDIDECAIGQHYCQETCVNTYGHYRCECRPGYELDPRDSRSCIPRECRPSCYPGQGVCANGQCQCNPGFRGSACEEDVDECKEGRHDCEQKCINRHGSFGCACFEGYKPLASNPSRCERVRCQPECVPGQGVCVNGVCQCRTGFIGRFCESDVDECRDGTHNCEQGCVNLPGSFQCSCQEGYRVSPHDLSRCEPLQCSPGCIEGQGVCRNGSCECYPGFAGATCARDVDECKEGGHDCEQICINTYGSYQCACHEGYRPINNDSRRCERAGCDPACVASQGDCKNGVCVCKEGFKGMSCEQDVDECQEGRHRCEQNCVNTYGGYECTCSPGFRPSPTDPKRCELLRCDPDCVEKQGYCENGVCKCYPGFTGSRCEGDIDECKLRMDECNHICVNTFGSYECRCNPGYELSLNDSHTCIPGDCMTNCVPGKGDCDVHGRCICRPGYEGPYCQHEADVCSTGHHSCEHICVSLPGKRHLCRCYPGFIADPHNHGKCIPHGCIPPCETDQGECDMKSKTCKCNPGFEGMSCEQNINECALKNGGCSHFCVDTYGSYRCECPTGMRLAPNNTKICVSDQQCNPPCVPDRGICVTTNYCKCKEGFTGRACEVVEDVCRSLRPCEQDCINLGSGKYECRCWSGFIPVKTADGTQCIRGCQEDGNCFYGRCIRGSCVCNGGYMGEHCDRDIDECRGEANVQAKCEQICINTPGSYECRCENGYELQADGYSCQRAAANDQEQCPGGCLNGGMCVNGCQCPPGFRGPRCEEVIDICRQKAPCDQLCYNKRPGGYICGCREGFELQTDGRTCKPTEACHPPCAGEATCFRGRCICPRGLKGPRCDEDVDECAAPVFIHGCAHGCLNTYGGYECICPTGYRQLADKKTCVPESPYSGCSRPCRNGGICQGNEMCSCTRGFQGADCSEDIDECATLMPCDPEHGFCVNRFGGYECVCAPGYILLRDGRHCIEESRARQAPHLVFRGHGVKGVTIGTMVNPDQPSLRSFLSPSRPLSTYSKSINKRWPR